MTTIHPAYFAIFICLSGAAGAGAADRVPVAGTDSLEPGNGVFRTGTSIDTPQTQGFEEEFARKIYLVADLLLAEGSLELAPLRASSLLKLVRNNIKTDWQDSRDGLGTLAFNEADKSIAIVQTPANHQLISELLASIRQAVQPKIRLDLLVVELPPSMQEGSDDGSNPMGDPVRQFKTEDLWIITSPPYLCSLQREAGVEPIEFHLIREGIKSGQEVKARIVDRPGNGLEITSTATLLEDGQGIAVNLHAVQKAGYPAVAQCKERVLQDGENLCLRFAGLPTQARSIQHATTFADTKDAKQYGVDQYIFVIPQVIPCSPHVPYAHLPMSDWSENPYISDETLEIDEKTMQKIEREWKVLRQLPRLVQSIQ